MWLVICPDEPSGFKNGQQRVFFGRVSPEPIITSVHFYFCLIAADYRTGRHRIFDQLANRGFFECKPHNDIVNAPMAKNNAVAIVEQFFRFALRKILSASSDSLQRSIHCTQIREGHKHDRDRRLCFLCRTRKFLS